MQNLIIRPKFFVCRYSFLSSETMFFLQLMSFRRVEFFKAVALC